MVGDSLLVTRTPAASAAPARPSAPVDPAAAVSIRGLVKRYGDFLAVDGLDLDIRPGDLVALLGRNGAGKPPSVEIGEGCRARAAGEVRVLGEHPADWARSW